MKHLSFDASAGANLDAFQTDYLKQTGSNYFGFANKSKPTGDEFLKISLTRMWFFL